jgi:cell division protein ZapA (FtsZ GTPase activity inhibitor)
LEDVVTIELFGQPYTFKAESEAARAKEVADFLVKEVNRIETQHSAEAGKITNLTIMILAALNIAHEAVELKQQHSFLLQQIYDKSRHMLARLETIQCQS